MAVSPRVLEAAGFPGPGRFARVRQWWEQEHVFGYGLILPALALLLSLVAFPFGMAIYFSLSDYWVGSPGGFVGLANYRAILDNEVFRQTVQNSFVFRDMESLEVLRTHHERRGWPPTPVACFALFVQSYFRRSRRLNG